MIEDREYILIRSRAIIGSIIFGAISLLSLSAYIAGFYFGVKVINLTICLMAQYVSFSMLVVSIVAIVDDNNLRRDAKRRGIELD